MVPVYTITCQLLSYRQTGCRFHLKTLYNCLKNAESFVNGWPENKPCKIKVLLTWQDANYVCKLIDRFLNSYSVFSSSLPTSENFPFQRQTSSRLSYCTIAQPSLPKEVDRVLCKFEQVVAARCPFHSFRVGNRLFAYISHDFHVKIIADGRIIPK